MSSSTASDDEVFDKKQLSHVPIEPDYKSVVSTLDVPDEYRALVLVRTAVPLNCHERTMPTHRCTFAFFHDTRLTVRNLMTQTRAYCGLLHNHKTHRSRLARLCTLGEEGDSLCTCHRGTACKIVSSAKQWLFLNRLDNTPMLPHDPRYDETEWFESIGTCASNMTCRTSPIDIDIVADMVPVYRRLEREGDDVFYDVPVDSAIEQGALNVRSSADMGNEIVQTYRASTHISFLCESTISTLIQTLSTYPSGQLPLTAINECVACECVPSDVNTCTVCNITMRIELTALLSAYDGSVQCSGRLDCTCIADALIRDSTRHVIEFDAVARTDDSTYIAMGDSIYAGQSPLTRLANVSSAQLGWRAPHYGAYYAVGTQQLKALRKRAASTYGSCVLGSNYREVFAEACHSCHMDNATTLAHIVVACDSATAPAMAQGLIPTLAQCRSVLKWLPRIGRVLLEPFCLGELEYAKLLQVVQSMVPPSKGAALDEDQDFERTMYRELQYESNKRMAIARVLAFIDDPTDFEHFARVAAALLITFGVITLAQRCCAEISERSCAEFLESLSADKERRKQQRQRAAVRAKLLAERARAKMARKKAAAALRKANAELQKRKKKEQRDLAKQRRRAKLLSKKARVAPVECRRVETPEKKPTPAPFASLPLDPTTQPFTWNRTFDASRLFYADALRDVLCCCTQ